MKPNYHLRLFKFSMALQRYDLVFRLNGTKATYPLAYTEGGIPYFEWPLMQLTAVFPRVWAPNNQNEPRLSRYPDKHVLVACRDFFGLDNAQCCSIFMPGHAYSPYNLPALKPEATLGDIAHQINSYVIAAEIDLQNSNLKFNLLI